MGRGVGTAWVLGLALAGTAGAQLLGQGPGAFEAGPPGRTDGIAPPSSGASTGSTSAPADGTYQVFRRGEGPGTSMPVLRPGETFCVRFPTQTDVALEVVFETPDGPLAATATADPAGALLTENVDSLLAPGTRSGAFAIQTNAGSPDAAAFVADLRARGGAGGTLPADGLGFLDASRATGFPGAEVLEGGGVRTLPFVARDPQGRERVRGRVAVAARARWLYFAGHYASRGVGGRMNGDPVTPATIEGTSWHEHLEVLVLAACSAGKAGDDARDGVDWWLKFEGTLLAYRHTAPTRAAPEIGRRFLDKVVAAGVRPGDRDRDSQILAQAWMEANLEVGNQVAVAFDTRGRYYLHLDWRAGVVPTRASRGGFWGNVLGAFAAGLPREVSSRISGGRYWVVDRAHWERQVPAASD